MTFRFANPECLLLLLLLPLLAWLRGRSGGRPAFLYSSATIVRDLATLPRARSGRFLVAFRWLGLALVILGLARPQWGEGETSVKASGIDIVIAIDLSASMLAEDFVLRGAPANRLEVARMVVERFIRRRPSDRIGLVAFAGQAYIASPLTLDHDFLQANLARLEIGSIPDGTAIGSALAAAQNRLKDLPSKSRIVILMTDGQNNAGKIPPEVAAEAAATLGIKVYTIGVGTKGLANFPYQDAFGRQRYKRMQVNIDEDTLKAIAEKTGGIYFRADRRETLESIYDSIDQLEKTEIEMATYQRYHEWFAWFVIPGLALLLLELLLGQTIWRRLP